MNQHILHSQSTTLLNTAAVAALIPTALGIVGILKPASAFEIFDFKPPLNIEDRKLATNLCLFWGSRDLYMGATMLAAWWVGDKKTLGCTYLAAAGVALIDVLQSQRQLGKMVWKHGFFVPIAIGIGGGLLGWFD